VLPEINTNTISPIVAIARATAPTGRVFPENRRRPGPITQFGG
jgi:hypothetical protein